jgi:hypothetical protein
VIGISSHLVTPAKAVPIEAQATALESIKINNPFNNAKDFHVVIHSTSENLNVTNIAPGPFVATSPINNNTSTVTINWVSDLTIPTGPIKIGFKTLQKDNFISITEAYFTSGGGISNPTKIPGGDVKIPGFQAQGEATYTIMNDFSEPLGITGLQFLVNVPELSFDGLDPGSMPGFGPPVPDFVLPAMGSMSFSFPENVDPGNFLYAQGSMFDVVSGDLTGSFIQGHQSPIAEPSTVLLVVAGLLAMGATAATRTTMRS